MKREEKYPDTDWFHYYNANPKNRITGDCAYRAISFATGLKWEDVVMEMAYRATQHKYSPASTKGISAYLDCKGFKKHPQPRRANGTKFTGREFCEWLNEHYNTPDKQMFPIVANIGGHHIVAIDYIDGKWKIHDIWDSSPKCIGNYWTFI